MTLESRESAFENRKRDPKCISFAVPRLDIGKVQIMAAAFAILASELLGYSVVFNPIGAGFGTYRRAAWRLNPGEEGD